ncbi:MAG: autotransporter domain-containing protein [Chthoniobacterales bacterium]
MKNPVQRMLRAYQGAAALGVFLTSSALQAHPTPDWLLSSTVDWLSLPDLTSLQSGGIGLDANLRVSPLTASNLAAHPSVAPASAVLSHGNALDPAIIPGPVTRWTFTPEGNWFDPDDWSNGVPTSTSTAVVANGGTAVIEESGLRTDAAGGATAQVGSLTIGSVNGPSGTVIVGSRGALDIFSSLTVNANGVLNGTFAAGAFIFNDGTVTNSGTITGRTQAIILEDGGSVVNNAGGKIEGIDSTSIGIQGLKASVDITNSGAISGGNNAIMLEAGGTITNDPGGSITAKTDEAIVITGGNGVVVNSGTISSGNTIAIFFDGSTGSVTNNSGGVLTGGPNHSVIYSTTQEISILNAGKISGLETGIHLSAGGSIMNTATGSIIGQGNAGITMDTSGNTTIVNSGIISAAANAIEFEDDAGGSLTNNPGGVITGGTNHLAVLGESGEISISNAGTINGGVTLGNASNAVTLLTGGVINGSLNLGSDTSSKLILDGSGVQTLTQAVTGTITDPGSLIKQGSGNWTIDEDLAAPISTDVNAGTLTVAQSATLTSSTVTIGSGGTLTGTGTISGNVTNSGIISPGDPFGTLTIRGNYTQTSNGVFRLELGGLSPGEFGQLAVTGNATLSGTLQVVRTGNIQFLPGDKLVFLTANSVTGSFSTIQNLGTTNTLVGVQVTVLPDAAEIVGTQGNFVSVACNPNSVAVAQALNSAVGDPRASALINFLDTQPLGQLCADFTLISPEDLTSVYALGVSLANIQTANLERRLEDIRSGSRGFSSSGLTINGSSPSFSDSLSGPTGSEGKSGPSALAPIPENRWGFFATGLGDFTDVSSADGARGFNFQTGGVTLGVDYRIGSNFAIGLTGGYAHTGVNLPDGGSIDVDGGTGGLYATAFGGGFYLDTAVTGGASDYETHRTALMGTANGSTSSGTVNVLVAGGYDWTTGPLTIGPTASFQYTYVSLDGFTETGSLAPLKFGDQSVDSDRLALGIKASYDWKIGGVLIRPELRLSWQHEFGDSTYSIVASFANGAGSSFSVNGPPIGRDSLLVGAGVAVLWNDRISTYIYYDGELARTNYDSQSVSAGVRFTF